ncbi:MAG: RnfABCDGE type electron transport complex subunit E [Planctomycetes bacterium]|nr:RnfABCDGE type electron transport complex subunit E [Planctomycetota bacterium]
MDYWQEFKKGLCKENAIFALPILGICPTLATSGSLKTGVAMGCAATFVLVCSNAIVSLVRRMVPREVRIPCFIVVIASFVTIVDLSMQAWFPTMSAAIGIFIPLIVVNCIILGRAEAFASKNNVFASLLDGLGMGIGYMGALVLISTVREVLGAGKIWGVPVFTILHDKLGFLPAYQPAAVIIMAPGAFLVLGLLLGFFNWIRILRSGV